MAALLADEDLVAHISAKAIAAKLKSGELVDMSALTFGELVLQPAGRLKELNTAIDKALAHIDAGQPGKAAKVLESTIPEDEVDGDEVEEGNRADPEPGQDPEGDIDGVDSTADVAPAEPAGDMPDPIPAEPAAPVEEAEAGEAPAPVRKRFVPPDIQKTYPCEDEECEAMVPGPDAQLSAVRCRDSETGESHIFCRAHIAAAAARFAA